MSADAPTVAEVIEESPIAKAIINTLGVAIKVPPGLVAELMQLVCDYAAQHGENELDCCGLVEIGVLQRGMQAMRGELNANKAFGERMGWPKEER